MAYSLNALTDLVNEAVSSGHDEARIFHSVMGSKWGKNVDPADIPHIKNDITLILENHPNYEDIQELMRCHLFILEDHKETLVQYNPLTHNSLHRKLSTVQKFVNSDKFLKYRLKAVSSEFNPRSPIKVRKDHNNRTVYNRYTPPRWMHDYFYNQIPIQPEPMPEIYEKFFKHLTANDEESYNYLINWMAYSLKDRNLTMLAAVGTQGIGKGFLATIVATLHGVDEGNAKAGSRGTQFKSQFNSVLEGKTFLEFSEFTAVTKDEINNWKQLANADIDIEAKGADIKSVKNYCNFIITANNMDAVRIASDDRRLSFLNLTDVPLADVCKDFGFKNVKDMVMGLTLNEKLINSLASYLWNFEADENLLSKPFASKALEKMRKAQLWDWEREFLASYCRQFAGKTVKLTDATVEMDQQLNKKLKLGEKSFKVLAAKILPLMKNLDGKSYFKITRKHQEDGSYPVVLKISSVSEQPPEDFLSNFDAIEEA
jgi:Family of unknown function (DUF5906)